LFIGSLSFSTSVSGLKVSKTVPSVSEVASTFTNRTTKDGLGSNDVNGVYAVGSMVYAATRGGLSISVDGGATFTNRTTENGLGDNDVNDVYAVGSMVYAATKGGLSISVDGGATFTNRTTENGLGSSRVFHVYAVGSTVYAGHECWAYCRTETSGLSISVDGGATFTNQTTENGLGRSSVFDVYAVGSMVYAAARGGLSISVDGGLNFSSKSWEETEVGPGIQIDSVYAVGSTVYVATSNSFGWSKLRNNWFWFDGGLMISVDGGATFTNRTTENGLGDNNVNDVYAVGSTVYAATGCYRLSLKPGGLSISVDGGATFTNRTTENGLGSNCVTDVHAVGSTVYAATYPEYRNPGGLSISVNGPAPTVTTTLINRRFTENPYVPPLVFGEAVEVAKKNFECPKVLILGFRGSGEQPIEFLEKDAFKLLRNGQTYKNWQPKSGFKIPDKYAKLKYTTNSANLYPAIFGQTVGPHVKAAREQIAKIKRLKISQVGIWSVGVDDLEFSTENPPQSAYHAPAVTIKIGPYINQIQNTIKQFEGLAIARQAEGDAGIINQFISSVNQLLGKKTQKRAVAEINNFYYALLLLKQFCPDLDGLYLIGYSSGAIAARFIAANSPANHLVDGDLVDSDTGLPRRALFLIADPLFDGALNAKQQPNQAVYPNDNFTEKNYDQFRKAKGLMMKSSQGICAPKFNENNCEKYSALQETFKITTLCAKGDFICATGYIRNPKNKTHSDYYKLNDVNFKDYKDKTQIFNYRVCDFLRQPSCSG
jgi:hypothetical protein